MYRHITYRELKHHVCRLANVLLAHGVRKGDRVCIYMPMIPETVYAMLACARIGAVHSVVFGGFSAEALRDRIVDAGCRLVLTANEGLRGGRRIPLKTIADRAVEGMSMVQTMLVARRTEHDVPMQPGRDFWLVRGDEEAALDVHGRVDGCRGPALHALHVWQHRETQGAPAHDRRLPRLRGAHPQAGVRLPPG